MYRIERREILALDFTERTGVSNPLSRRAI
jgi:hypothetical protein